MLQLCINWECVGGLRLTLPGVLQLEQPWELYCHIRGYSYNPRGARTLAHPALQSLMNYATEAVFILLSVPLAWISVSYLFWQEEGGCAVAIVCARERCAHPRVLSGRRRKVVHVFVSEHETEMVPWKWWAGVSECLCSPISSWSHEAGALFTGLTRLIHPAHTPASLCHTFFPPL